jgi:hypothetical protein
MKLFAKIVILSLTLRSAHAEVGGFEVGTGVALTGAVSRVNFNFDKRHSFSIGSGLRVGLLEIQITYTNGITRRSTMLQAGRHAVRVPLSIELAEILAGSMCLLALVGGTFALSSFGLRHRRAQPVAAPTGGRTVSSINSRATEGPPSVS